MAIIPSAQLGDWSLNASWQGGVIPGPGDQPVIKHAITLSDYRTTGTSPAAPTGVPTTWDLDIESTGSLTITPTGYLTLNGNGRDQTAASAAGGVVVSLQDGSIFEFGSVSGGAYRWYNGTSLWNYRRWQGRGAFVIRGNGRLMGATAGGQGFLCDFDGAGKRGLLSGLGGGATQAAMAIGGGPSGSSVVQTKLVDVTVDNCWGLKNDNGGNVGTSHVFLMRRVSFVNSPAALDYNLKISTGGTGTATIDDCAFEDAVFATYGAGISVTNSSLLNGFTWAGAQLAAWSDNLLSIGSSGDGRQPCATMLREYRIIPRTAGNPKGLSLAGASLLTSTDCVFETLQAALDDGEYIATNNATAGTTSTISRVLFIGQRDGLGLRWAEYNTNVQIRVILDHATGAAQPACMGFGHAGDDGTTTDRGEVRDAICADFRDGGGSGYLVNWISNDVADGALPANVHHNCCHRLSSSRYPSAGGPGYGLKQSNPAAVMGSGDVSVDPWTHWPTDPAARRAVIPRLETWGRSLGLTGTATQVEDAALAAIAVRNLPGHPSYVAGATPAALRSWVASGWATTNPALRYAASDGGAIGAAGYRAVAQAVAPQGLSVSITPGTPSLAAGPVTVAPPGLATAVTPGPPSVVAGSATVVPQGGAIPATPGSPSVGSGQIAISPAGLVIAISAGAPVVAATTSVLAVPGHAIDLVPGIPGVAPPEPVLFEVELETYLKAVLAIPVWAGYIPQDKKYAPTNDVPALVYNLISTDEGETLEEPDDVVPYTFQFDAYAPKRLHAAKLIARLSAVLRGYRGMMGRAEVCNVLRGNQNHGMDPMPDGSGGSTQRRMVEYVIYFRDYPPTP